MIFPALIGVGLAAYAALSPGTGVTGSVGAFLALFGAGSVLIGGLLAALTKRNGLAFGLLAALILIGSVLTALAAFFLMQFVLAVVMGLTALGMLVVLLRPARTRRPV